MRLFALLLLFTGPFISMAQTADEHVEIGSILFEHGKLDDAQNHFFQALQLDIHHCGAQMMLGGVMEEKGRYVEALQYLRACTPKAEDEALHAFFLGRALRENNKPLEAIDYFTKSITSPHSARLYSVTEIRYQRALTYHDLMQYENAIVDLNICMRMIDYNPKYYWLRAQCHLYTKAPDLAIADVNQALAHQPDQLTKSNVLMIRGDAFRQKGDSTTACADYIEAYNLGNIIAGYRASLCPGSPTYKKTLVSSPTKNETIEVSEEVPQKEEPQRTTLDPNQLTWDHLATETTTETPAKSGSCMTGHNVCSSVKEAIAAKKNEFESAKGAILDGEGTGSVIYLSNIRFPGARSSLIVEMTGFQTVLSVTFMDPSDSYDLDISYTDLVELTRGCIRLSGNTIRKEESDTTSHRFFLLTTEHPANDDYLQAKHGVMIEIRKEFGELVLAM